MSRIVRQTALSGLFGSKRFIVSVCAAIAMVLGALSVGASFFVPQSAAETQEQAAHSPIFTERDGKSSNTSRENGGLFTNQQILVPNALEQQKSNSIPIHVTTPKVKTGLSIQFGPVDATAGISLGGLQVTTEAALAPIIEVPTLPTTPVETSNPETPPAEQPPAEEPTTETSEPPKEQDQNTTSTLNSTVDTPQSDTTAQ